MKKTILYILGSFLLVLGIAFVLAWWPDVVVLFRGGIGMAMALGGLLILYSLNQK
jgi:hypothetical protein